MDSIRASEAPDSGSIPDEATKGKYFLNINTEILVFTLSILGTSQLLGFSSNHNFN
jgi:hypothetical protein